MKLKYILPLLLFCFPLRAQDFVFVFLNKKQHTEELPKEKEDALMEGHMANINRLAREGKLIAAGPFTGGGGIFIFKSNSLKQVDEWLSSDPGVKANRWDVERFPYKPRVGSVCPVSEPFEMTSYFFVRYGLNITKYSIGELGREIQEHDLYLKKQTGVIAEGSLGDEEGGILVLKTEPTKELLERDPAVQKGAIEFEVKKLYIARGSFCESRL